jgi:hypothetical protein
MKAVPKEAGIKTLLKTALVARRPVPFHNLQRRGSYHKKKAPWTGIVICGKGRPLRAPDPLSSSSIRWLEKYVGLSGLGMRQIIPGMTFLSHIPH